MFTFAFLFEKSTALSIKIETTDQGLLISEHDLEHIYQESLKHLIDEQIDQLNAMASEKRALGARDQNS